MGAIVAAGIATGKSFAELDNIIAKELWFSKFLEIWFWTGLIPWNKIFKCFEKIFWDMRVCDTQIPLKIVASRLEDNKKVVFTDTRICDALRASMSIPWIFEPHEIDGMHYVDGMMFENLPITECSGENIIAVSTLFTENYDFSSTRKLMKKVANIALTQNEQISLQASENKNITLIRPEFDEIDFHDFHKYKSCREIGYVATKEILW